MKQPFLHLLGPCLAVAAVVSVACGPQATPAARGGAPQAAPDAPAARKIMRIGVEEGPNDLLGPLTSVRTAAYRIADAGLTTPSGINGEPLPTLAAEIPSLEKGTWKVLPDSAMEVTWKLRPNIKWHDGQPMTSNDLLFFFEYLAHPESALPKLLWTPLVDQISAPDAHTLMIRLKSIHIEARVAHASSNPLVRGFPRHILGPTFASGNMEAFHNSPHWRDEFIGLGPYRLVGWEPGIRMSFERFDDFFLGRPPLDVVILSFHPDVNTLIANILAGEMEVLWEGTLQAKESVELNRRWEGTGNRVITGDEGHLRHLMYQARAGVDVRPAAIRDRAVRQALFRGLDRDSIGMSVHLGLAPLADSWIPPKDPRREVQALRDAIIQYQYDPGRAVRELESLGWRKGGDGILVNQQGERFEFELRGGVGEPVATFLPVLMDSFKQIGVSIVPNLAHGRDRSWEPQSSGMLLGSNGYRTLESARFHAAQTRTAENRWTGYNTSGYSNPELDALYDRLIGTISADERVLIQAEIVRHALTELPTMPLFWTVVGTAATAKVKDIPPPTPFGAEGWHLWEWDMLP